MGIVRLCRSSWEIPRDLRIKLGGHYFDVEYRRCRTLRSLAAGTPQEEKSPEPLKSLKTCPHSVNAHL
ncbi:hypothetical protein BDFB_012884 [Asbolus verrucosus]|uniref:Uncharacterized protein n=1 Tax=Asbolus verrucosus TaxID=1661398 RepID=A0A482WEB2_ASBVE|nr:hypothetical protein BDFB_012884 [Asbolus verrucosus]